MFLLLKEILIEIHLFFFSILLFCCLGTIKAKIRSNFLNIYLMLVCKLHIINTLKNMDNFCPLLSLINAVFFSFVIFAFNYVRILLHFKNTFS